jgi:hypothetical protein
VPRGWYLRSVIRLEALRTLALTLTEEQFLARHPDPALVLGSDVQLASRGDPMAWLNKTVADEEPEDLGYTGEATLMASKSLVDPGLTPSPEVDLLARNARAAVFFVKKSQELFPDMVTIGRVPNNDVVLGFPTVSKVHAYLRREGQGWRLHDQRSRNGTFVDQRRLEPGGSIALEDGAQLHIGPSLTLTFLLPPSLYGLCRGARRPRG